MILYIMLNIYVICIYHITHIQRRQSALKIGGRAS